MVPPVMRPGGDLGRALPDDHRDRAEDEEDDDRGHHRPHEDSPLGGREHALDGLGETRGFAGLLVERLHDLHRAEDFARDGADVGDPVLAPHRDGADAAAEECRRKHNDDRTDEDRRSKLRCQREQDDDAGDPENRVAQGDRNGGAHHLLDDRGIDGDSRGDLRGAVFFEEAGRQAQQIAVHREPNVGDRSLAQPGYTIISDRRRNRENADEEQQIFEPARDVARGAGAMREAFVDDQLERVRDARVAPAATSSASAAMAIWPG